MEDHSTDSNEEVTTEYTGTLVPCNDCNLWFATETSLKHHHCKKTGLLQVVEGPVAQSSDNKRHDVGMVVEDPGDIQRKSAGFKCSDEQKVASKEKATPSLEKGTESNEQLKDQQVPSTSCNPIIESKPQVTLSFEKAIENKDEQFKEQQISNKSCYPITEGNNREIERSKHSKKSTKNYYTCSRCTPSRKFSSGKALQTHHMRCHVQVLAHSCHNCGHHFKHTIEGAKSIRTVYTQSGEDGWTCEICCKELSSFEEIKQHKLLSHNVNSKHKSPRDRFMCRYCTKTYQFRCQLRNHELVHTGTKAHKCPHCPKSFRLKGQLDVHVNMHTKQTIYSCGECGADFYQATTLHHHLRSKHQEWKFKCRICQKAHVTKNDMLEHECIHTGIKPYICEECGVGFPRKQNLNNHLKAHRNERHFPCTTCGKAFFRKSTLKEHFRTHSGEKPYQCQRCDKRFTQKSHLRAHLRSHLRQELERHVVTESDTGTVKATEMLTDAKPIEKMPDVGNTVHEDSADNVGVQNELTISDTAVECVVYVENDNSGSDTQTAEERVENNDGTVIFHLESSFEKQN